MLRHKYRQAFKLWSVQRTESNRQAFKAHKATYQRKIRNAKLSSWNKLCDSQPSSSDLFSALKTKSGKSANVSLPSSISIDGSVSSNPTDILKKCAEHFFPSPTPSTQAHAQAEELAASFSQSSATFCVPSNSPPISQEERSNAIASLNLKSAPGADGLSTAIKCTISKQIFVQLLFIMNACFSLSHFPSCWKVAKVTIIGKPNKAAYDTLNSFRPISLVNTFANILEKLILNRLLWHSSISQWLSQNQHGFTQGRSTETAAHSLISFCDEGRDAKCVTACAFLDIKSAFDAACHTAIISSLAVRNCPRYLVQLVFDFLSNRTAILSLEGSSSSFHVDLGCPQGGVLSPFLCSVLVDDVLHLKFSFPFRILGYADDLTVATYHKDPSIATRNLQTMCDEVSIWCLNSKLSLNAIKKVFMIMCKRLFDWSHLSITINGMLIPPSIETLFLGLTIDCQLKWNSQVANKISAAKRAFFTLRSGLKSTWGYDRMRLKFLYHSAVEPILLYGCSVWAPFLNTKKGVKQQRTFQRSIALSLASSFKTVSAEACFILTNILLIDLCIQEITHLRFSSGCTGFFSALSLKWLTGKLPSCSPLIKCDSYRRHSNQYWPPWAPPLFPTLLSEVCTLLPTKDSVLRIFVATSRCGDSFNCCIISTSVIRT